MKKINSIFLLGVLVLFSQSLFSQTQLLLNPSNSWVVSKSFKVDTSGVIYWKCDSLQPNSLFTTHKLFTGLGMNDNMQLVRTWKDSFTFNYHSLYQQYYKGLLVEGAQYREHFDTRGVMATNGMVVENLDLTNIAVISEATALANALNHLNSTLYAWQDTAYSDSFPQFYPHGQLVYYNSLNDFNPNHYKLAWKFGIVSSQPMLSYYVYINAVNGLYIDKISTICQGDANTHYYGPKYIDTKWYGGLKNKHFLWANDDNRAIKTRQEKSTNNLSNNGWKYNDLPSDSDGDFGTSDRDETSSHYAITEAWQSYKTLFGRSGLNNFNKELRVIVKSSGLAGAFYDDLRSSSDADYIQIEKVLAGGTLASTYDISAHEFAHGIDHYEGNLNYINESGALEESFADIFGFMAERRSEPSTWDWLIGEEATSLHRRSLSSPSSETFQKTILDPGNVFNYPNTYPTVYKGANWYSGIGDNGGVHINSSVQNYWFYLLSMGGTQLGQTVTGIGIDKAAKIAFYSFTNFVGGNETFQQARIHSILAAEILYGRCSDEVKEVCKAWKAVGVGPLCCLPSEILGHGWELCRPFPSPEFRVNLTQPDFESSIKVFPNPASSILTISFKEIMNEYRTEGKIVIYSVEGKEILSREFDKSTDLVNFDITDLLSGVYFVKIIGGNQVYTHKFVKQ